MNTNPKTNIPLMPEPDLVLRAISEQREQILDGIASKQIEPTPALMIKLAHLNAVLGDAPEVQHGS